MNQSQRSVASRRPRLVPALAGAIGWSFCCACLALLHLNGSDRLATFHVSLLIAIVAGGAATAWLVSLPALMLIRRMLGERRGLIVAAAFLGLGLATISFTAFFFALDYRAFYARWHADPFTRDWFLQQIFTSASALYQFLVIGSRLYLPLGPLVLAPATLILLRSTR